MIKKSFVKIKEQYKVTFEVPAEQVSEGRDVRVLGTFNGWSWDEGLHMPFGKSAYKADIHLAPGEYQFRYLVDNQEWKNDWDAPGYTASGYASDNCLLSLDKVVVEKKVVAKPSAKKAAPAKKTTAKPAAKKAAPAKKAAAKKVTVDDLKRIEGIGPKIAGLLNAASITTFDDLAKATPKKLADVLTAAGARFRLANPGSWQQQAKLVAAGKIDALKKLQDELKGGVKK